MGPIAGTATHPTTPIPGLHGLPCPSAYASAVHGVRTSLVLHGVC